MIIFPAIDIKNGKCVRLRQGKFDEENVYFDYPFEVAKTWENAGAQFIHIVDLDGALGGKRKNISEIEKICATTNIPIQLGGGIRTIDDIKECLSIGINRVIIGTSAINNTNFIKEALTQFGERIVVSLDASNGFIATDGWTKVTNILAGEFAATLENYGLKTIVYTDISKDGMMQGANYEELLQMQKCTKMNIIASGGVSSIDAVLKIKNMNLYGAIIGKALYTKDIILQEALAAAK